MDLALISECHEDLLTRDGLEPSVVINILTTILVVADQRFDQLSWWEAMWHTDMVLEK